MRLRVLIITLLFFLMIALPIHARAFRANVDSAGIKAAHSLAGADVTYGNIYSYVVGIWPTHGGIVVYTDHIIRLEDKKTVYLELGSGEYAVAADVYADGGYIAVITSEGNVLLYDSELTLLWKAYYSFSSEMRNASLEDVYGDDSPEIIVWGQSSQLISVISREGYPLYDLSAGDAAIIKRVEGISIQNEKYLVVAYYSTSGDYILALYKGENRVASTMILRNYAGEPSLSIDLAIYAARNELAVVAVSESTAQNVTLELYNISQTLDLSLENSYVVGISEGWVDVEWNEYLVVYSKSLVYVWNDTFNATWDPGLLLSASFDDGLLYAFRVPSGLVYEKYLVFARIDAGISIVNETLIGTSSMRIRVYGLNAIASCDGGARFILFDGGRIVASVDFSANLRFISARDGVYAYNAFGLYEIYVNGSMRSIFKTDNQILDVSYGDEGLCVLERTNEAGYNLVCLGNSSVVREFALVGLQILSVSGIHKNIISIGLKSTSNSSSYIMLMNVSSGDINFLNASFEPDSIVNFGSGWLAFEVLSSRIYAFDSEGFIGYRFLGDYLVVDAYSLGAKVALKVVDVSQGDYDLIILGPHMESVLFLDNIQGPVSQNYYFGSEIYVLRRTYGLTLTIINLTDLSFFDFDVGDGLFTAVSEIYYPNSLNIYTAYGDSEIRLIRVNRTTSSVEYSNINIDCSVSLGFVVDKETFLLANNESGVYAVIVEPAVDYDYPEVMLSVVGVNIYANYFVSKAENFGFNLSTFDDTMISELKINVEMLDQRNNSVYEESIERYNTTGEAITYSIEPPNTSVLVVISVEITDLSGKYINVEAKVYLDHQKPKIIPLFPENTTKGKSLLVRVFDDVMIQSVYAVSGGNVIALRLIGGNASIGTPAIYILDEYEGGEVEIIAVDFVGRSDSIIIGKSTFETAYGGIIGSMLFFVGMLIGYLIRVVAPKLRELSDSLAVRLRHALRS